MNPAQLALLKKIAEGSYLPTTNHTVIANLSLLYRNGYIRYGRTNVEVTAIGSAVLRLQKAGA